MNTPTLTIDANLAEPTPTDAAAADDDKAFCETCNAEMTDEELYDFGCYCTDCYQKAHFTCTDCNETLDNDERSSKSKSRCESCQEAKDEAELEEKMEALTDEARNLLESIFNDADLPLLKKTVTALKRLQPE